MKRASVTTVTREIARVAEGWRWGRRPLVPRSVPLPPVENRQFPTEWARTPAGQAARALILRFGFGLLLRFEVNARVFGTEILEELEPPVIFVANHQSHLDAPLIMTSLPPEWRDRTAVGAAADYFFDVWWRAAGTALAFNAFPVERAGGHRSAGVARRLMRDGWSLLVFPQGTRSRDGWIEEFKAGAGALAIVSHRPVVPVALRGTYQAMPRGRGWPKPGRPEVRVRFGTPVWPEPSENAREFTHRIRKALEVTIYEDQTDWWTARRAIERGEVPDLSGPKAASWRRRWESSKPIPERRRAFGRSR